MKFRYFLFILFILFCIITLSFKVNAASNNDTSWNITLPNYNEMLENVSCGSFGTMKDVVDSIIENTSTEYYSLVVGNPRTNNGNTTIAFYIKWASSISFQKLRYYAFKESGVAYYKIYTNFIYSNNTDRIPYYNLSSQNCSTYSTNSDYLMYKNLTDTGNFSVASSVGGFNYNNYTLPAFDSEFSTQLSTLSDNSSYDFNGNWFYYFTENPTYTYIFPNATSYFNKKLCFTINDSCYVENDTLPSYLDLVGSDDNPTFIGYQTSLDTFYTSLLPNNFNNYSLKVKFNTPQSILGYSQDPQDYVSNTYFEFVCSARINNSNYYTYEQIPCSVTTSYSLTSSSVEYTFNNLTTTSSLTNYDKIFVTIKSNYYDSNVNTIINSLSYTYNLGSIYNFSYKGAIYESFSSLPLNFKLYVSSNNDPSESNLYVKKYNFINYNIKYAGFSNESTKQNAVIGTSILGNIDDSEDNTFLKLNITSQNDSGFLIYQDNGSILLPSLDLIFNNGFVISFNNTSSDTYYYVDSDGNIDTNSYIKPSIKEDNNYDLTYYIDKVNSFIDDLSEECIEFSQLTQSFYNGLPVIFQSFLFVLFILACCYFTYLLINRR